MINRNNYGSSAIGLSRYKQDFLEEKLNEISIELQNRSSDILTLGSKIETLEKDVRGIKNVR